MPELHGSADEVDSWVRVTSEPLVLPGGEVDHHPGERPVGEPERFRVTDERAAVARLRELNTAHAPWLTVRYAF